MRVRLEAQQVPIPTTAAQVPGGPTGNCYDHGLRPNGGAHGVSVGRPLVNNVNHSKAFAEATEPGLLGGVVPVAFNRNAMLTSYIKPIRILSPARIRMSCRHRLHGAGQRTDRLQVPTSKIVSGSTRTTMRAPAWLSDALCRLASGGSFAVRQLYTDDEEVLFKAARPTLLNGIEDTIGRSDLADRAILLTLGPISEEQRRSETELWREFELARPAILGALLDAAAHGLRAVGSVHLGRLPRMADFALWATACETGLWPAGTFTRAYAANRKAAIESMIDADPIAACVREFMSERPSWTGSAADLLRVSVERSSDRIPRDGTGWPKNPRALAGHLRRAQTFLRALGIEIAFSRQGRSGSRVIRMRSFPENTVSTVSSVSDSASGADSEQQP